MRLCDLLNGFDLKTQIKVSEPKENVELTIYEGQIADIPFKLNRYGWYYITEASVASNIIHITIAKEMPCSC